MIRPSMIWGLARAEARLTRRLVRYWVFLGLATLLAALSFTQFVFIYKMFSWSSASAALTYPRYFVGNFGANFLFVFLVGLIFLGFDLRARDRRERIVEVLDAVPCSNLELVLGRFVGLLLAAWIPIVVITALLALVGFLVGTPLQPHSLFAFVVFMALPAYMFTIGLVYMVTLLVRHRLWAAIVSVVIIIAAFFVSLWWIPFYMTPFTDVTGGYSLVFPSDLVPGFVTFEGFVQRLGYAVAGLALLVGAAAIHPRADDGSRARRAGAAVLMLVVGVGLCAWPVLRSRGTLADKQRWTASHEARNDDPTPDLLALTGAIKIDPGRRIDLDLELRFRAPEQEPLESALFTLNPGMRVSEIRGADDEPLSFSHEDGLLDVRLARPLAPGATSRLRALVAGRPRPEFAYFNAAIDPLELVPTQAQIIVLGYDEIKFERGYLALLPGVRWLPQTGSDVGRGDPTVHPRDFYRLDVTVELPAGWLVAGPGRRQEVGESSDGPGVRYRFAPDAPLPEVALVAGRFESFSTEIDGVRLELLLHPGHTTNAEFFTDAAVEIKDWLTEHLAEADAVGFTYPYDALTMVEVPNALRGYGGGWRMDSTLIQPAMILVRESGFPTAHFEGGRRRFERARDEEGGVPRAKRQALERFFENDLNGGNPFVAAARSFFGFQTAGAGPDGVPLDYVWETLSSELVTDKRGYFSVHFFDQDFGQEFMLAGQAMNDPNRYSDNYSEVLVHRITSTNKVWDTLTGISLTELDPREDPERAINVLSLKGGAMAASMLDDLGREKTGQLLAALRSRRLGRSYTRPDVIAAGEEIGEDLDEWARLWLDGTDLPGFRLGDVRYYRLPEDESGAPQYQTMITVQNGELPDGLVRLEYRTESQHGTARRQRGEPIRIEGRSAVQIGLVTTEPLRSLRVVPYLALNRDPFNVPLPSLDSEKIVEAEPFVGSRRLEWEPADEESIVVDDLDDGFSVAERAGRSMLRFAGRGGDEDLDGGLPTADRRVRTSRWSRVTYPDAYGRYRHTMAVVRAGEGERRATFAAELPNAGPWELDLHVPGWRSGRPGRRRELTRGTWTLTLEDDSGSQEVSFDADGAETGWNSLGRFEMASGGVRVILSDATEGDYVQADAIRWKPVDGGARDRLARAVPAPAGAP